MKIETVKISELKSDPNNARVHNNANLEAIAGSLTQFGQRKPIVVSSDNVVIAGNGTLSAAQSLGWTEIELVRIPNDWDSDRIKAFALADNRTAELAQWDYQLLASQILELQEVEFDLESVGFDLGQEQLPESEIEMAFENLGKEKGDMEVMTFTLHKDQAETLRNALAESKQMGDFGDTGNTNGNGNALARIAELWLGSHVG